PGGRPSSAEMAATAFARVSLNAAETVSDVRPGQPPGAHRSAERRRPQIRLGCTITITLCLLVGIAVGDVLLSRKMLERSQEAGPGSGGQAGGGNEGGVQQPNLWVPDGWTAAPEAGTGTHGPKEYYKKITRKIGGEDVAALLVLPTRAGEAPF